MTPEAYASVTAVFLSVVLTHLISLRKREQWNAKIERQLLVMQFWIRAIADKQKVKLPQPEDLP